MSAYQMSRSVEADFQSSTLKIIKTQTTKEEKHEKNAYEMQRTGMQ